MIKNNKNMLQQIESIWYLVYHAFVIMSYTVSEHVNQNLIVEFRYFNLANSGSILVTVEVYLQVLCVINLVIFVDF